MLPQDLICHALRLALSSKADEADLRRAVSAAYYGLFNAITKAGADLLAGSSPALHTLIARSFEHRAARRVCEVFRTPASQPFLRLYGPLLPQGPDARLHLVADAFCRLQEARQTADYDIAAPFSTSDARADVQAATKAVADWAAIQHTPEAHVFLTALLLADRWTRRG